MGSGCVKKKLKCGWNTKNTTGINYAWSDAKKENNHLKVPLKNTCGKKQGETPTEAPPTYTNINMNTSTKISLLTG